MSLTLGSLFDGIGAFPLVARRSGITPVWASEISPDAISITRRHFPEMIHLGSITDLHGGGIPPVDIVTFGSPCQDMSIAGNRSGINGDRSSLCPGMNGPYDDIIDLPHPVSARRPQMPRETRAAQFSPFAALTGYEDAIEETARLTDERIELAEGRVADLDIKLNILADRMVDHPSIAVTYFQPDEKKQGGAYLTAAGAVKKIDDVERVIVLMSGERIAIADILEIEGALFEDLI